MSVDDERHEQAHGDHRDPRDEHRMVNECQIGSELSRVVPVRSVSTAAICEPFAGKSQTPTSEGHIAVTTAIGMPAPRAIGTIVLVVAD
jgi:hypothetical protein